MNLRKILLHKGVNTGISIVLILAILLGLGIPGSNLHILQPQKPASVQIEQQIEELQLGKGNLKEDMENEESEQGGKSDKEEIETEEEKAQEESSEEKQPEEKESEKSNQEDADDGQEDGPKGEDGGEETELDFAMVMTWYKYGTQAKTIVCDPSGTVSGDVNTAQLINNELKYKFFLTGERADEVKITAVSVKEGDGDFREISEKGEMDISLQDASAGRDYTFQVRTLWKTKDAQGKRSEQEVVFTYVIRCAYALDLELELSWEKKNGQMGTVVCASNDSVVRNIRSTDITENVFVYSPKLIGALAKDAKLVSGKYQTASGTMGVLNVEGDNLILQTEGAEEKENYYLTFEAELTDKDGNIRTIYYNITIVYIETLDIDLNFTWLEKGSTPRTLICKPDEKVSTDIKNNQLSAGTVKYEIVLTGSDSENARILNMSYESEAAGNGILNESGALPMHLPKGYTSNTYTISVVVLSGGKQINYEIILRYSMDVSLEMTYTVKENGMPSTRKIVCENGKIKTAEAIYDDQLANGKLSYRMKITGTEKLNINSVSCYQSGSGSSIPLDDADEIELLLKNGKTGENTFTVTAEDKQGRVFTFEINVPYKHRGEKNIKISTNMTDGQVVTNETATNLNVSAWSEDDAGNVESYIPANGTDTKLIVKLDGEQIQYVSSSGPASEYILYPKNPEKGDTNEHELYIYAEDGYGNYGELTLMLKGQRSQAGQKKGTATIYIDLTVLGLGVVDSVSYEVLTDEPISYSIAKAVLGQDTGEPFGAAANALGWGGQYKGTLDTGFYLQRLTPGVSANALGKSSWNQYGSSETEILEAIDKKFGKGTGLATLWRCIYRNGLNKSSGSDGTYGEYDYTSGSGWLYSLNGTYYPGLSMSEYSLENGDVLTIRYTLANGWDVGGGTKGYGNTIGYCVTAINGNYYINHQMETIEHEDGSMTYECHYCGLSEGCAHGHVISKNQGDGTHVAYCEDCDTTIGDPESHTWKSENDTHICSACEASEAHNWKEVDGTNTATCTVAGKREVTCTECAMTREEDAPAKGHTLNNRWNHTKTEHYQKCSTCKEQIAESQGKHQYEYHAGDDDWYCKICDAGHDWDYCGNSKLTIDSATCVKIIYFCKECNMNLEKKGDFSEYHSYTVGECIYCGKKDSDYIPPEPEPEPEEPEQEGEI